MINQIILDLPSETLLALKVQPEAVGDALRMAAAVKFFEWGACLRARRHTWLVCHVWFFSRISQITVWTLFA